MEVRNVPKIIIARSDSIAKIFHDAYFKTLKGLDLEQECFMVALLDGKNEPIKVEVLAIGTPTGTHINGRRIFRFALMNNASSVILGHNHPSGRLVYSSEDKKLTRMMVEAGENLSIPVLDHIVFSTENKEELKFKSFNDEGLL